MSRSLLAVKGLVGLEHSEAEAKLTVGVVSRCQKLRVNYWMQRRELGLWVQEDL